MKPILARIRAIITQNGISDSQFAKEMNAAQTTISNMFQRDSEPRSDLLEKIITTYNVNPKWLLLGEGEMINAIQEPKKEITEKKHKIPVLKPCINPAENWETEANVEKYLEPFRVLQVERGEIWAFRASGIAMIGLGIQDGDILFFGSQPIGGHTDGIYIFALKGEVFCRFLRFESLNMKIHIFAARQRDLRDAELLKTIDAGDKDFLLLGKVIAWLHENTFVNNVR